MITANVSHRLFQCCRNFRCLSQQESFSLLHDQNPQSQRLHLSDEMDHHSLGKSRLPGAQSYCPNTTTKAMTRVVVSVCSSGRRRLQRPHKHGPCQIIVQSTSSLEAAA